MIEKIRNRESDLKNMFNELIRESEENEKKALELKQLNVKIQGLEREIKMAEQEIDSNDNKLKYFKAQVTSIANSDDDAKTAGRRLKQLVEQCERPEVEF
jgi:cell shape-determining protein MreC